MRIATSDLALEHLFVVHPGPDSFPMDNGIDAVSIVEVDEKLTPLVPKPAN